MITQQISPTVESIARGAASVIVDLAGWMVDINNTCSRMRQEFMDAAKKDPKSAANFRLVADRAEEILRGYHAAVETNDAGAIIGQFLYLIPQELQDKMHKRAMTVLADCGIAAEQYKDETGETFLKVDGIEKLGIPAGEMARMHAMAGDMPTPVGELRRVH